MKKPRPDAARVSHARAPGLCGRGGRATGCIQAGPRPAGGRKPEPRRKRRLHSPPGAMGVEVRSRSAAWGVTLPHRGTLGPGRRGGRRPVSCACRASAGAKQQPQLRPFPSPARPNHPRWYQYRPHELRGRAEEGAWRRQNIGGGWPSCRLDSPARLPLVLPTVATPIELASVFAAAKASSALRDAGSRLAAKLVTDSSTDHPTPQVRHNSPRPRAAPRWPYARRALTPHRFIARSRWPGHANVVRQHSPAAW